MFVVVGDNALQAREGYSIGILTFVIKFHFNIAENPDGMWVGSFTACIALTVGRWDGIRSQIHPGFEVAKSFLLNFGIIHCIDVQLRKLQFWPKKRGFIKSGNSEITNCN